ncbi:MAG: DUF92 domain-containing protein [Candidatus Baldrarchaeia archaeon]
MTNFDPLYVIMGAVIVALLGVLSLKTKAVDKSGFLAGFFVGFSIWIFLGWQFFIVILMFHTIAAVFTHFKYDIKRRRGVAEEKGGARAWYNVLANGGLPAILAIFEGLAKFSGMMADIFIAGFIGAVSTACADTLATEIGLLYPSKPRLITNLKKRVEPGTSGGVTPLGEIAIIFGSLLIGFTAYVVTASPLLFIIALISGFVGATFDSILGATIQGTYRCRVCNKITEKRIHCNCETIYLRGFKVVGNNAVNFTATTIGALTAMILFTVL